MGPKAHGIGSGMRVRIARNAIGALPYWCARYAERGIVGRVLGPGLLGMGWRIAFPKLDEPGETMVVALNASRLVRIIDGARNRRREPFEIRRPQPLMPPPGAGISLTI